MFSTQTQKTIFFSGTYSGYRNSNVLSGITPYNSGGFWCDSGSSGSGSSGGGSGGGASSGSLMILNLYSDLAIVVTNINNILYNYSIGNMEYVLSKLTKATYYDMTLKLTKIKQNADIYPEYENIRTFAERTLQGLYKSIYTYLDLQSSQRALDVMTEKESVLHDISKLKEYISSLAGSVALFPDISVTSISATLRPEIAEYIKLFGLPANGVFETDKMSIALQNISYVSPPIVV